MSLAGVRVLVVEDDPPIRHFLRLALEHDGCIVDEAGDVARGLIQAAAGRPELLILDLGLPDRDGVELIRELRSWSAAPVIVLSARAEEAGKIAALDAGADDYLVKPFGTGELMARVRAQLRRRPVGLGDGAPNFRFGAVEVDFAARRVSRAGAGVSLTPIEYRMLMLFIQHAGKVLTHRQILLSVWGPGHSERTHYLRVYMQALRQKLELQPARPHHLLTEIGVGYRFQPGAWPPSEGGAD
jgi:two-component system KDP operon response regulator KdpE